MQRMALVAQTPNFRQRGLFHPGGTIMMLLS
jgi:hypothetical protein